MNALHFLSQKNFSTLASRLCDAETHGEIAGELMTQTGNFAPIAIQHGTLEEDAYLHAVKAAHAGHEAFTLIVSKAVGTGYVVAAPDDPRDGCICGHAYHPDHYRPSCDYCVKGVR